MTPEERACQYCVYRSYCARGVAAGSLTEGDEEFEPEGEIQIDFDQIAEISF